MRTHRCIAMAMALVCSVGMTVLLGSCRQEPQPPPDSVPPLPGGPRIKEEVDAMRAAGAGKVVAVVPKGTTHDFWTSVKAGAEAAGKEYGCEIKWQGPTKETQVDKQVTIIQRFTTEGVDGIVMAACDAAALVPHLQAAKDQGIVVVTIDSGIMDRAIPASNVATDNVAAAAKAADTLAELIEEEGDIGIITFDPNAESSIDRERGFVDQLKEKYPNIKIAEILCCDSDTAKALSVTESMLNNHPELKGIFAANQPGGQGAAQGLKNRPELDVKLVAFDSSEAELEALEEGIIQALIVQNPYAMGYKGVEQAILALAGKEVERLLDTEVVVVTQENIDDPEVQTIVRPLEPQAERAERERGS